jgi:protein-S-isoprenylcysteine O-methyltransferase Ste14
MMKTTNWLSGCMLVLAALIGGGSIALFVGWPLGTLRIVSPRCSEATVLFWDGALSMLFFVQHSGMIRKTARARMAEAIPPVYQPAVYAIASGLVLLGVVLLWQPSEVHFYALTGLTRHVARGLSVAAVGLFLWGLWSLKAFDPLGVRVLARHLRAQPPEPCAFAARGAYRFVRHPLYLAVIVLVWSCPDVSSDRLLFNMSWTAWIIVGTVLEEADLVAQLGDTHRAYRRNVPMLIPNMGSRGEGYVVVQLALMALLAFGPRTLPGLPGWPALLQRPASFTGVALIVLGSALVLTGIVALGHNLCAAPRPKQGATLIERGPYRLVRHPMYAGAALMAFGWALTIHGPLTLAYAAVLLVFFDVKARREERWLQDEVAGYVAYVRRVCRLIPFVY